jgi:hypothetical protein
MKRFYSELGVGTLIKNSPKAYLVLLILFYFSLGIYLAIHNSLTSDEPAYIGAAYLYQHGQGFNQEHPLLLKVANAIGLSLLFPNLQIPIPKIDPSDYAQIGTITYTTGFKVLMFLPERLQTIVLFSRFIYLFFNSILLFWLYLYTFIIPKINPRIALTLATLYVFSPSFYSHSFLITFDCSAAIYALLTIFSIAITIASLKQWSKKSLVFQFTIITILLFCALNVKFSNMILLPIVIASYLSALVYLFFTRQFRLLQYFGILSGFSLLIQPVLISTLYHYAFGSLPGQSFLDNFNRFIQGILMTKGMVNEVRIPFLDGDFRQITYSQYISKIFWFKENLGLFAISLLFLVIVCYSTWKSLRNKQSLHRIRKMMMQVGLLHFILIFAFALLFVIYPCLYFYLAKDSRLVIGYRHFYPVLIFIYLFLAFSTVIIKSKSQMIVFKICLAVYVFLGIIGIPQSLSYVNFFWQQEKWLLVNDSSLNWGQENLNVVNYILSNKILSEDKK